MSRYRTLGGLLALAVLASLPALGCTAQARKESPAEERETPPAGNKEGSDEAPSASEVGREVEKAAGEVAEKVEKAAGEAGEKIENAAEGLAPKVDAAKQLADVKMALMADPNVDGSAIDVDADEATKTIHLSGTVPTAAQKTAAERIARQKAQGYKIHNMLAVRVR